MTHRILHALIALLLLPVITGCDHKDLCYHHKHMVKLRLEFDWSDCEDPERPDGMCVFFYPEEPGLEIRRFDFTGLHGGEISIAAGRYRLLTYNNDTESVLFRGMDVHSTHEVYTRTGGLFESVARGNLSNKGIPRAEGTEEEDVVICPDMMWGCSAIDVKISEQGVSYICIPVKDKDEWVGRPPIVTESTIILYPHELTCIYTYEIRNVKNINNFYQATASLSGMAPNLMLAEEEMGRKPVTLPFEAYSDGVSKITGRFITFGHHAELPDPHRMMLYVWTKDGKAYSFGSESPRFNVTDQVHSAPIRRHVHLIIDGLDIPTPIDPPTPDVPGDFNPDIDDWGEVFKDIFI